MARRRDNSSARARGRVGRAAGWLTESRGVAAAVAFMLGVGLQSADVIDRIVPDHRTKPSDLVGRVEVTSSDVVPELGTMMLLRYGSKLPPFPRSGHCSESAAESMAKTGHQVSLWLRVTLTNSSHGAAASELFVSNLRADAKRREKPAAGVQLWCRARPGGHQTAYLAAMNLDRSNRATVAEQAEQDASGLEFAPTVDLQPGESVQFDLHVSATDFDYSFALAADVLCGGCQQSTVRLGGQKRFRVYSASASAPYLMSPAARDPGDKQMFHVSPADEVDKKVIDSPVKLEFDQVPNRRDQREIMRQLGIAFRAAEG